MPRRSAPRRAPKRTHLYKQIKNGRISKYGITNSPRQRRRQNAKAGYGSTMKVIGGSYSRSAVRRAESYKIRSYARRYGRRPWGNKTW